MAATLRSIHGVNRCTKSRTALALTPTGTTISTRPPTCTRAVSRRARGLTRTAKGSLELRVSNSDNCVPCGFIAPHDTRFGSRCRFTARTRLASCLCAALKSGATIRDFSIQLRAPEQIAARLQLHPEREIRLRVSPARHVDARWRRIDRKSARQAVTARMRADFPASRVWSARDRPWPIRYRTRGLRGASAKAALSRSAARERNSTASKCLCFASFA